MAGYMIWSFEHRQWWGPGHCGYTPDMEKAGRYTAEEAGAIVTDSVLLEEVAILSEVAARYGGPPKYHPYHGAQDASGPGSCE